MTARDRLRDAFLAHGVRRGEFQLSAGGTSSWYLDGRLVTFRGDCFADVGRAAVETLEAVSATGFDAVGGMTMGADPVALAIASALGIRAFSVRKEAKGYGAGGRFAGPIEATDRVLAVDDTATTGSSLLRAIDALRGLGCVVVGALVLLDRGGQLGQNLAELDIPYHPVLGAPDLGFEFGS